MSNQKDIEKFVGFFKNELKQILDLQCRSERVFKNLLIISLLDAISRSVYPRKSNSQRMVCLLENFSYWKDINRVSLTHIERLTVLAPDPAFEELRQYARNELRKWSRGDLVQITRDPEIAEVKKRWPKGKKHGEEYKLPIGRVSIEALTHGHLFYTYRNTLVHELRIPGGGMEMKGDDVPFYHSTTSIGASPDGGNEESWRLVYPIKFLENICSTCLDNLESYYQRNDLNPYNYYQFGHYWIGELN